MYNYFNNLHLNYKLKILIIFNTFMYFRIKYDSLDKKYSNKTVYNEYFWLFFGTFG